MATLDAGTLFLKTLLNSKNQNGTGTLRDNLIAHVSPDGGPHSGGPEHDFMHGRRGSGTYGDGTSKSEPRFNQDGRTFGDGTPLTSENYEAFQINPNVAPGLYNPFEGQTVNGVPRTPENSSVQQFPSFGSPAAQFGAELDRQQMMDIQQSPSGPYNPFEGQWIIDEFGNAIPRTPPNSVPGP